MQHSAIAVSRDMKSMISSKSAVKTALCFRGFQYLGIHDIDRLAGEVSEYLIEDFAELGLVSVAFTSAPGSISGARLVLTISAAGFMRARSAAITMPRVASTKRICREMTSHTSKKASLLRAALYPSALALARDA